MKPWYTSKTVVFNLLAVLVLVANQFGFADFQLDARWEAVIIAIVNLILRLFFTRQPLGWR